MLSAVLTPPSNACCIGTFSPIVLYVVLVRWGEVRENIVKDGLACEIKDEGTKRGKKKRKGRENK